VRFSFSFSFTVSRSTHCAFYHWRPHLSSDCCIGLEQSARVTAGVSPVIAVVASFPQQTENRTFCLVLQPRLTTSHCADYPELFVPQSAPTASTILLPAAAKSAVTDVKSRYLLCGPMTAFVYFDRWVKVTEDPASDLRFSLFYFITWLHCLGLLLHVLVVLGLNATLKFIRPSSSSSSLLLPSSHFYGKLKL